MNSIKYFVYLQFQNKNDFLAQPVEQLTLNQWVRSSILRGVTLVGKSWLIPDLPFFLPSKIPFKLSKHGLLHSSE